MSGITIRAEPPPSEIPLTAFEPPMRSAASMEISGPGATRPSVPRWPSAWAAPRIDAAERLRVRREISAPLVSDLEAWLREERARLSRSAAVAKPIDYMLKRWDRFAGFLKDGRVCLTTDGVEKPSFPQQIFFLPSGGTCRHTSTILA